MLGGIYYTYIIIRIRSVANELLKCTATATAMCYMIVIAKESPEGFVPSKGR